MGKACHSQRSATCDGEASVAMVVVERGHCLSTTQETAAGDVFGGRWETMIVSILARSVLLITMLLNKSLRALDDVLANCDVAVANLARQRGQSSIDMLGW
jgi:hypothetical protein